MYADQRAHDVFWMTAEERNNQVSDPFEGWTMANVGCHWSRKMPNGKMAHMSSGSSGYALWIDYQRMDFPDLDSVLKAYEELAA